MRLIESTLPYSLRDIKCPRHPEMSAVLRCQACSKPTCETCDFCLFGEVHVCPDCALGRDYRLSQKRRNMLVWSFIMAAIATVTLKLTMSGAFAGLAGAGRDAELLRKVIGTIIFAPPAIGTGLSIGALDHRLANPGVIWAAVAWNSLLFAAFAVMAAIGTFMR